MTASEEKISAAGKKYFGIFRLICLCLIMTTAAFSQNSDSKLSELRKQFGVDYLKPEAHFALAQHYLNKNDKVQAFFILEYARRYRFSEKDFDAAFKKHFGDNSAEPEEKAKKAFEESYSLLKQNKLDEAEQSFIKAANLAPKSAFIQAWVGRFFYKTKPNNAQALKYYFNAYFLDSHAYETEYAESRIRHITIAAAAVRFEELTKAGKTPAEISTDENPRVVSRAIEQMGEQWKKEYLKSLLECLENDNSGVRWQAFVTIFKNADAPAAKEIISALLNDKDLRKRGLAAYAIVEHTQDKGFDILRKMLAEKAELIRFDAASALAMRGGADGLEILRQHQAVETNPILKELIAKTLEKK